MGRLHAVSMWAGIGITVILVAAVQPIAPCGAEAKNRSYKSREFDWPQWRGPERTARSKETGLLQEWPEQGPNLVWKAKDLGGGYSSPSVAAGRIFSMSYRGDDEVVWALNEDDGSEIWCTKIAKKTKVPSGNDEGSRSTPTVDGDLVYCLGVGGELVCISADKGEIQWQKNLVKEYFACFMPSGGFCESVLIDGDLLLCTPGGKEKEFVALDKKTGNVKWESKFPKADKPCYASMIVAEVGGVRQYIQFMYHGLVGISAKDGELLWRYKLNSKEGNEKSSTPIFHENRVLASVARGTGSGLLQLTAKDGKCEAKEVYLTKKLQNYFSGLVLVDDYVYGEHYLGVHKGNLACLDFFKGELKWMSPKTGPGSIAFADGRLYYRNSGGIMILAEANSNKYVECGRFTQPDHSDDIRAWTPPVIANGKLYLRDQDVLLCYDIKKAPSK